MAAVPPGQPIAPGISMTNDFPQYGVQGNVGSLGSDLSIVEASNESQKEAYESEGVLLWFSSESAAESYISSEQSILGTGGGTATNPLTGINAIGDFFQRLTQKNTWIRIGEGVFAIVLLDLAIKAFTGTSVIESTAKKATGTAKKGAEIGAMVA